MSYLSTSLKSIIMAYLNQSSESYYEEFKPQTFRHSISTDAIKFGLLACLYLFTYFIFLELFQIDTLLLHAIGKIIIIGAIMFYAFAEFKKKARRFGFSRRLKFAMLISAVIAFTLILGQVSALYFLDFELVPAALDNFKGGIISLNLLLFFEIFAYSLIISLAANIYFRRDLSASIRT